MWCWFAFFLFIFEESLPTEIFYHNIEVQAEKREKIKVWYLLKKHHLCFIFNFSLGPCCFWDALNMNNKLDDRIRYDASSWLINKTIIITIIIVIWARFHAKDTNCVIQINMRLFFANHNKTSTAKSADLMTLRVFVIHYYCVSFLFYSPSTMDDFLSLIFI